MAAIRSTYPIVKLLRADGYKIIDKVADDRLFFDEPDKGPDNSRDDFLKRRIDRIQIFKGIIQYYSDYGHSFLKSELVDIWVP